MGATCCNTSLVAADDFSQLQRTIASSQSGKYLKQNDFPPGFYVAVKRALVDAEEKLGEPVHHVDIYRSLIAQGMTDSKPTSIGPMCFVLFDMVRNDEVLTDDEMNRYTL